MGAKIVSKIPPSMPLKAAQFEPLLVRRGRVIYHAAYDLRTKNQYFQKAFWTNLGFDA